MAAARRSKGGLALRPAVPCADTAATRLPPPQRRQVAMAHGPQPLVELVDQRLPGHVQTNDGRVRYDASCLMRARKEVRARRGHRRRAQGRADRLPIRNHARPCPSGIPFSAPQSPCSAGRALRGACRRVPARAAACHSCGAIPSPALRRISPRSPPCSGPAARRSAARSAASPWSPAATAGRVPPARDAACGWRA